MLEKNVNLGKTSKEELYKSYIKALEEKELLEQERVVADHQILKSKQRTIEVYKKMVDLRKAQKIITSQNQELEAKNVEINKQKDAVERTFQKFRLRTIELFGKMIDLKKANRFIEFQKDEMENQRKQLHEINASKDKFFSIIAHDLKNPIAGFLGLTEILAQKRIHLSPDDQQLFAETLHDSSKQLYNLLENLLHWARSQTGSLQLNPQELDLNYLLESTISQVATNAELKKITIQKQKESSISIFADEDTMITVFRNILSNAIKFSHQNGRIDISAIKNKKFAKVSITDYGLGISEENLEKLFKIDQTVSQKGTADETGTGLGLILCKEFVELNGGKVNVKSISKKTTTFTITIPLFIIQKC